MLNCLTFRRSLLSQDEARYEDEKMLKNNLLVPADGPSQQTEPSPNDLVINMDLLGCAISSPTTLQVVDENPSSLFPETEPIVLTKQKIGKRRTAVTQSFQLEVSVKKK